MISTETTNTMKQPPIETISSVPLLDLKAQYALLRDEIEPVVKRILDSQYFIMGPEVGELECECARYCQTPFALGVSSGTDALLLALMALDIGPGDEVITTPYSFFATAGSIARVGAKPVFVDIDPRSYNIDPAKIEEKVTSKTRAIMPVHLYGQCAEMDPIMEIARRHRLSVIEDAAQAIGSEYRGRRAGAIGDIGCFSFFPSKNLGAFGDAGLVTCLTEEQNERLKTLRVHGSKTKYYHSFVGGNFRIDTLQAAVLTIKLRYLDSWSEGRQGNAADYRRLFAESGLVQDGAGTRTEGIVLPVELAERRHIYNQFVIRVPRRDEVLAHLKANGIGSEIYYPLSLHEQECFQYLGGKRGDCPESERAAGETLAIPIYPELTPAQRARVVEVVTEAVRR